MGLVFVLVAGATLVPGAVLLVVGLRVSRGPSGGAGRTGRTPTATLGGFALLVLGTALIVLGLAALAQLVAHLP